MAVIGSQQGGSDRLPTLRQYVKAGLKVPAIVPIRLIFFPGKLSKSYGLLSENTFRVSVYEHENLHRDLTELLDKIEDESLALYIRVTDEKSLQFEVGWSEDHLTAWEKADWGMRAEEGCLYRPLKTRKQQKGVGPQAG